MVGTGVAEEVDDDELPEDELPEDELLEDVLCWLLPDDWLDDDELEVVWVLDALALMRLQEPTSSPNTATAVSARTRRIAAWRRAGVCLAALAEAGPLVGACPAEAIMTSPVGLATQPST